MDELPYGVRAKFPAVLTYKYACDQAVVSMLRSRTLGNSPTALQNKFVELHSEEWIRKQAMYLHDCLLQENGLRMLRQPIPVYENSGGLPIPNWLARKKAIISPKNEDQECFKWAVIAASRWEEINNNPERISKLKRFEKDFDWSGIGFPVSVKDIKKFEFRNQISINLLATEGKQIYICRKGGNYERIINIMLITGNNRKHYVAIKSLSRLLSSQNIKHKGKEYFGMNCLQGLNEESSRDEHLDYCINNESVKIEMPHRKLIVKYSDGQFQFKVPFIMYADFESILKPIQGLENNPRISSTRGINNHIPSGWCVRSEFAYGKVENPLKLYRGEDCVKKFCDHVIGEARRLYQSFPEKPMKPLTPKEMDTRDRKGATFALSHSKKINQR